MSLPHEIGELIERFDRNVDEYRSGQYNETQLRRDFLDPFFEALGWDVNNQKGYGEAYRDVVHEDAIKIGGHTKAPDYGFYAGPARKFFVEAKKPSVNVKRDMAAAFQLRRYGWSAKLPLSILTNFDEFAVYDCRQLKPASSDGASTARILYYTYKDYAEKWDEIAGVFSRDAVWKGSFDKYAEQKKGRRGTAEVDDAFLEEIESWRKTLASNIYLRNPELTTRELNFAVGLIIDRIIFLRICEDRGIEPDEQLKKLIAGKNVYAELLGVFYRADQKYNSGLFHFEEEKNRGEAPDTLTPKLTIDDKVLKDIFRNIYLPVSPYEFSVLPADILGQVYEQFLGKVIHLTAHRAEVQDKPEVRKAGGVYYTPTYIVAYIVENTVGKLCEGKTPKQVDKLRILDPACGSGSFLIGAYQYLLDWYHAWYVSDGADKHLKQLTKGASGEWHLTTAEKRRILLNNIYGVDIDSQAVEVTKLSLLLKVLEGESERSLAKQLTMLHERALPDLGSNIKCGNSLIGTDFYNEPEANDLDVEEMYRINPFDWNKGFPEIMKAGGFDAVIGNPPYDVMEKERDASSWPHTALSDYVRIREDYKYALGGKLNLFRFFIVQSLKLTSDAGQYGMIVPMALLADISCAQTRKHLIFSTNNLLADCFPQKDNSNRRVFKSAKLSTVIITANKSDTASEASAAITVKVYPWNSFDDPCRESTIKFEDMALLDPKNIPIPLVDARQWSICRKIHSRLGVMRLGDVQDFSVTRGEINQTIYRKYIVDDPAMARLLKGVEISRYRIREQLSQGHKEWFNEKKFLSNFAPKPVVKENRIATQRITGVDERLRIVATLIEPPAYFADSTNSIFLQPQSPYQYEYLLGLLNSWLFQWRFKLTSTNNNVGTNELESMPFPAVNFSNAADKARHDRMVEMVERMLSLHKQKAAARTDQEQTMIERRIEATDAQIDRLVYELYELTAEEIKIVEEATR